MKKILLMLLCLVASLGAWADWSLSYKAPDGDWNYNVVPLADGNVYLNLEGNKTYSLYILVDGNGWASGDATMTEGNSTNYDLTGYGDATQTQLKIQTTRAGVYKFTASWYDDKQHLTAVYPSTTTNLQDYVYANNVPALTWLTKDNGDVQISISDAPGATNVKFRNGGLEGGLNGLKVCSGSGFSTKEDASTYFNRQGGGDGTTVIALTKKAELPNPCIIEFQTNALAWSCTENGGAYTWPKYDYIYGTSIQQILANITVSSNKVVCHHNETAELTTAFIGNYGGVVEASVVYSVDASVGTIVNNVFTPAENFKGKATITAVATDATDSNIQVNGSADVYVYDTTDNVAFNKTVTVEEGTIGEGSYLVDGNLTGNTWKCNNEEDKTWNDGNGNYDATHQSWALIDLGNLYDIDMINVYFDGGCSHGYGIWYSLDGINFREAYTYSRDCGANHQHKDFLYAGVESNGVTDNSVDATNVRYIKYINTSMGAWGARLYEIEVYGTVNQSAVVDVTGVALNKTTATLVEGETETLVATIVPVDATNKVVNWSSSASNIATVDANGLVTAVYPGVAIITARTADGNFTAICNVTVTADNSKPHTVAPVPTKDAKDVIALYSDTYTCVNVTSKNSWGELPVSVETVLGDNYWHYTINKTATNNGIQFASQNLTDYGYMHIDIWSEVAGTMTLTLKDAGLPTVTLAAQQWNSFDLPLSAAGLNESNIADVAHIKINEASAELKDHKIAVDNIYFWKETSVNVTVSSVGWGTYYNAKAYTMPEGLEGYIMKDVDGTIKSVKAYEAGEVVPAQTALLLKNAGNYTLNFTTGGDANKAEGNLLKGNLVEGLTTGGGDGAKYYKLAVGANGLGWYYGSEDNTTGAAFISGANKAYLVVEGPAASNRFISLEGESSITSIEAVENTTLNAPIYDLQGRRVRNAQNGMYIVNGRKVIR